MKKRILMTMMVALAAITIFTGCGEKTECGFCGKEKKCETKTVFGEEINVCKDCLDEMNEMFE